MEFRRFLNSLELVTSLIRGRKVIRQAAMIPTWDSTRPQTDMDVIIAVESKYCKYNGHLSQTH